MEIKELRSAISNQNLLFLYCFVVLFCSCKNTGLKSVKNKSITGIFSETKYEEELVVKDLMDAIVAKKGFIYNKDSIKIDDEISNLYKLNNYQTLWLTQTGTNENCADLFKNLETLREHGINPQRYNLNFLKDVAKSIDKKTKIENEEVVQFDIAMTNSLINSSKALLNGVYNDTMFYDDWFSKDDSAIGSGKILAYLNEGNIEKLYKDCEPNLPLYKTLKSNLKKLVALKQASDWQPIENLKDSLVDGFENEQVKNLRKRLNSEINIPTDTSSTKMDGLLLQAIKKFQYVHDLRITGKLDTSTLKRLNTNLDEKIAILKVNMERLRWVKSNLPQPYVWVNIPKMELNYVDNDSLKYNMRVVVGRPTRPTPCLDADMTNVVINPNWSVPPTIMTEEIIPGVSRRGGSYLARRGLTAYLGSRKVDPRMINANNFKRFRIEQKPGLNSALGAVKFNLPNRHAIYLHDTPHREDFKKYYRAYSSGCIRVEKPRDFAEFVLQDTNYTRPKIDSMIKYKTTKQINLKQNIPVHIVYLTNGIDSAGNLLYLRDIYKKDEAMKSVLF